MTPPPDVSRASAAGPSPMTLDEQIALAELAVIRRDERIRRRVGAIAHRAKAGALRHAGSGAAIGAAAMVLAWWLNRRKPPAGAPRHGAAPAAPAAPADGEHLVRDAGLSLAALLPLIWPYLPHSVRKNVTPGTAGTILSVVSPLVARLFRRRPAPRPEA